MLLEGPDHVNADAFVAHEDVAQPQHQCFVVRYVLSLSLFSRSNFHPPTIEEMVPRPSM